MSLLDFDFFAFVAAVLLFYYVIGGNFQKYILMIASIYFYYIVAPTSSKKLVMLMIFMIAVPYIGGILIEKSSGVIREVIAFLAVLALAGALFFLRDLYNVLAEFLIDVKYAALLARVKFFSVLGLSYYALSAISYLFDVKWELCEAEKNPAKIALFVFYFPQMFSGPITRYPQMSHQFDAVHKLDYDNIANGLQRMLWGYFKKLVISERFALVSSAIFRHYDDYSGIVIIFAAMCYAIQLYTDFSGCMDIIIGISQLFGITLPENFDAPFFSCSIREFWRRWHISLGLWFKDYVMFPVQRSKFISSVGKYFKAKFNKNFAKKIQFYLSMFVLWFLIGVWHGGTAYYFVASGLVPFVLLVVSDIFVPSESKTDNAIIKIFQRLRTILLVCISFVFVCSGSVAEGIEVFARIFGHFIAPNTPRISLMSYVNHADIVLMLFGVAIVLLSDFMRDKKLPPAEYIRSRAGIVQYGIFYLGILLIMFFGMTGNSDFIYLQF